MTIHCYINRWPVNCKLGQVFECQKWYILLVTSTFVICGRWASCMHAYQGNSSFNSLGSLPILCWHSVSSYTVPYYCLMDMIFGLACVQQQIVIIASAIHIYSTMVIWNILCITYHNYFTPSLSWYDTMCA